jgi:hypothetical protein
MEGQWSMFPCSVHSIQFSNIMEGQWSMFPCSVYSIEFINIMVTELPFMECGENFHALRALTFPDLRQVEPIHYRQ